MRDRDKRLDNIDSAIPEQEDVTLTPEQEARAWELVQLASNHAQEINGKLIIPDWDIIHEIEQWAINQHLSWVGDIKQILQDSGHYLNVEYYKQLIRDRGYPANEAELAYIQGRQVQP